MKPTPQKLVFVLGGVMSGIGKGITTASLSKLMQSCGHTVSAIKVDPYLNVDAGTMNPTEHGEVFVLDSGLETDQDMGNYERFLNLSLPEINYLTNGLIFKTVIDQERQGYYQGKCVEPTQHISEEIHRRIKISQRLTKAEITFVEIGGTVGEYQNAIFIEAARRLRLESPTDVVFILVSYLPTPPSIGEMKTKPTQNAVHQLNSYGVQPDFIVARSEDPIDEKRREKIALSCGLKPHRIIAAPNARSIYDVPVDFANQNAHQYLLESLGLELKNQPDLSAWNNFIESSQTIKATVKIGIIGKYFETGDYVLSDAYLSVIEALKISGAYNNAKLELTWLDPTEYEKISDSEVAKELSSYQGIVIPGGFGSRGVEGKITAIQYARINRIPCLGLCYGMQLMCIEYARNVVGLTEANSTEANPDTQYPVVTILDDQKKIITSGTIGGTMRKGSYPCHVAPHSIAFNAYKKPLVHERHRHRYEINPEFTKQLSDNGLIFSGTSPDGALVEIVELPTDENAFFLGTQFHPEFLARPLDPHPLFNSFINACVNNDHTK